MKQKKSKLLTAGRIVLLAIISIFIGLKLYAWNARSLTGNEMPMPFGYGISVVLSGSMEPELSVDDLVIVRPADSYEVDDIVVYQEGNSLVIHRIISINVEDGIAVTMGDANDIADDPIKISNIKGRAVLHIPYVGAIARFLRTPAVTVIMLLAAATLFELPYLRERKRASNEQEKIKEEIRRLKGE